MAWMPEITCTDQWNSNTSGSPKTCWDVYLWSRFTLQVLPTRATSSGSSKQASHVDTIRAYGFPLQSCSFPLGSNDWSKPPVTEATVSRCPCIRSHISAVYQSLESSWCCTPYESQLLLQSKMKALSYGSSTSSTTDDWKQVCPFILPWRYFSKWF